MNKTGGYPGQPRPWLYPLWYKLAGFDSANIDLLAIYLTGVATIQLLVIFCSRAARCLAPGPRSLHIRWHTNPYGLSPDATAGPSVG